MTIEDLLVKSDDEIKNPGLELTVHVAIKGVQTGAILSTLATLLVTLKDRKKTAIGILSTIVFYACT